MRQIHRELSTEIEEGEPNPVFLTVDEVTPATWKPFGGEGEPSTAVLTSPVKNFYMTDPISRVSPTMAVCTDLRSGAGEAKTGTDG